MSTGQDLLNRMELLHPEMQLQPGETDVVKGLLAANIAQDYLESLLALTPQAFGDSSGTLVTTPQSETTPYPDGVLRIDSLWRLDDLGRPSYPIEMAQDTGGHLNYTPWPESIAYATYGMPSSAWPNGRQIFWGPIPDLAYSVRWYGLQQQPDITAAGTIQWTDICLAPMATFACKAYRVGLDDSAAQLTSLASDLFEPVIKTLTNFRRDVPTRLTYSRVHVT